MLTTSWRSFSQAQLNYVSRDGDPAGEAGAGPKRPGAVLRRLLLKPCLGKESSTCLCDVVRYRSFS
jgi:hypothetical protein